MTMPSDTCCVFGDRMGVVGPERTVNPDQGLSGGGIQQQLVVGGKRATQLEEEVRKGRGGLQKSGGWV